MGIRITGVVEWAKLKTRAPYDPHIGQYSRNTEYLEFYAEVKLKTEEDTVFFNSPPITRTITTGGPFAIVSYNFPKRGSKFLAEMHCREENQTSVAVSREPNSNMLVMLIKEGDTITIDCRLKAEKTSRHGNKYRTVNYVQRIS